MNKNDLIESIANESGLSKTEAGRALEAFTSSVIDCLKKGSEVRLVGFGTFFSIKSVARDGRNPRTGEKIKIPSSIQPKFRAGKALKEILNNKRSN